VSSPTDAEIERLFAGFRVMGVSDAAIATLRQLLEERREMRAALTEALQVHDNNRGEYFMHEALVRDIRALLAGHREHPGHFARGEP
jgi:hypothetical protein